MGLLIMLIKTNIVQLTGKRGTDDLYNADDVVFSVNPFIVDFFNVEERGKSIDVENILLTLKSNNLLKDILEWERVNYRYETSAAKYGDTSDKATLEALEQLKNDKDAIEMELQRSEISY